MAGLPTVAPPTVQPLPRPDVTPPPVGTFLLYAQGQQIGHLPLNGTRLQKDMAKTLLSLHVRGFLLWGWDCTGLSDLNQGLREREVLEGFWAAVPLLESDTAVQEVGHCLPGVPSD